MRRDKEKLQKRWKVNNLGSILAIFLEEGGGGVKYLDSGKLRKKFLLHNMQNNLKKIRHEDPIYFNPPPPMYKYIAEICF